MNADTTSEHNGSQPESVIWWRDSPSFASAIPHLLRTAIGTLIVAGACLLPWWRSDVAAAAAVGVGIILAIGGLWPLACTEYTADDQRLIVRLGVWGQHTESLEMYRIQDADADKAWWERIWGIGRVTVLSSDAYHPRWVLRGVHHPDDLRNQLTARASAARRARGVREVTIGR